MTEDSHLESAKKPVVRDSFNSLSDTSTQVQAPNISKELATIDGKAVCHEDGFGFYTWPDRTLIDDGVAHGLEGHVTKLPFKYDEETLATNVSGYLAVRAHEGETPFIAPSLKDAIADLTGTPQSDISMQNHFENANPSQQKPEAPGVEHNGPHQDFV